MAAETVCGARRLAGALTIPGDKSIAHRAAILGALAEGVTRIERLAPGEDVRSTLACVRALGAEVDVDEAEARALVRGVGAAGFRAPAGPLDCGNSGTTMRLLAGALATQAIEAVLVGDASLSRRPMRRVADPLRRFGATIATTATAAGPDRPPLRLKGTGAARGLAFESPIASAQVKSAVLLAGLRAEGETSVHEPARSRDHTERMLRLFGVDVLEDSGAPRLRGPVELEAASVLVPGDISSAAFFLSAAVALPGSRLVLRDVGVNPTRTGILSVLERMGASIQLGGVEDWGFEPVADLIVQARGGLVATAIAGAEIPTVIDELPVLAVLATQAEGVTEIRDAAELRVKETDRVAETVGLIEALGGVAEALPDGLRVRGPQRLRGGAAVDAKGDHRLAMAAAIGALFAAEPLRIDGAEAAAVSYPGFFRDLAAVTEAR